jgi:hypothetical protein
VQKKGLAKTVLTRENLYKLILTIFGLTLFPGIFFSGVSWHDADEEVFGTRYWLFGIAVYQKDKIKIRQK